jgi:hypothetical protein
VSLAARQRLWFLWALWWEGGLHFEGGCMVTSATDLIPIDFRFFLWGHLKEHDYAVPPRTIEDLVERLQATTTSVDANMLRRVRENVLRRSAVCLEMEGGASNAYCNYGEPMVRSFCTLTIWRWLVSWKVNFTGHMLHNIFDFLTSNYTMASLCSNFCSPYIYEGEGIRLLTTFILLHFYSICIQSFGHILTVFRCITLKV